MTRAFVAVVPSDDALDAVGALEWPDVPGARLSGRHQWHVTLQFLGNRVDVDAVTEALGALAVGAGPARLGGAGAFPSARRGRVLWLGLTEGGPFFAQLAAAVGALLGPIGYEPEKRPFHPHITLARWKAPTDLRPVVEELGTDPVGPPWRVGEIVLFESKTRPTGAEYVARSRFRLQPRA